MTLENRIVLVTGAGRGIGRAIAEKLATRGAHVVCVSRSENSCQSTANSINGSGGSASWHAVDVSDGQAVAESAKSILNEHGQVDILVNNAGITRDGMILRMSSENWHDVMNTNLSSCYYWVKHLAYPMARQRWGRIVNITSVSGLRGNAGQASSKAGMIGLTKSLAKEFASRKITVNAVAPGFIETDMTSGLDEKTRDLILKNIPLKRLGQPSDIAHVVDFLCSEKAGYITGQVFTVDGGMVM